MDKSSIIQSVKRQEEDKVGFSLKLPASLKDQLQEISEKESISMNSLIIAVVQSFIDDDCGKKLRDLAQYISIYRNTLYSDLDKIERGEFRDVYDEDGEPVDISDVVDSIESSIEKINLLLKDV
jgi:hypothetical protein